MRKRKQGDTNPRGETKAIIILYIADNQKTQTDEIREFLKKKEKGLRITTKNLIYRHLKELESSNYIQRIRQENNNPDIFVIKEGFENFKNLYLYLRDLEQEYEIDLMQTPYYKEYVESDDFCVKLIINTFKELILCAYSDITKDIDEDELKKQFEDETPGIRELFREQGAEKEGEAFIDNITKVTFEQVSSLKKGDPNDKHIKIMNIVLKFLADNTVDDIYQLSLDYISKNGTMNKTIPPEQAILLLISYLIPEKEKETFSNILKTSPTAIEYIIDIKNHSPITFFNSMYTFFLIVISKDPVKRELLFSDKPLTQSDFDLIRDYSNIKNESPIVLLAKSAFVLDSLDEHIITNEFYNELTNQLFSPQFKEGDKQ